MPRKAKIRQVLLVEGKNDQHVIWNLCKYHQVAETFLVETPFQDQSQGIDAVLRDIPVRLKQRGLQSLGIVVDANQSLQSRWQAICQRLTQANYQNLPIQPNSNGVIINETDKPTVGIWIMPDNELPGMLENFVAHLIPDDDLLAVKTETYLQEIERENLNRYSLTYHSKAFIHAWLACQKIPGQPMGQAITAQVLQSDKPLALTFINWLNSIFNK